MSLHSQRNSNVYFSDEVLKPVNINMVPSELPENKALFSVEGDKVWYMGKLSPWDEFTSTVVEFWKGPTCQKAVSEEKNQASHVHDVHTNHMSHNSDILAHHFQCEVVEVVKTQYNYMMDTAFGCIATDKVVLTQAADYQSLASPEYEWNPKYVICKQQPPGNEKAKGTDQSTGNEQTKVIGHVEYLAGKPRALTEAWDNMAENTWGSLRCVLGDIAKWMIMGRVINGFLATSDEIIFLQLDIETGAYNVPRIFCSKPFKYSDSLDVQNETIAARLAFLFFLYVGMAPDEPLPEDMGKAMEYFPTTKVDEDLKLERPKLPEWLKYKDDSNKTWVQIQQRFRSRYAQRE